VRVDYEFPGGALVEVFVSLWCLVERHRSSRHPLRAPLRRANLVLTCVVSSGKLPAHQRTRRTLAPGRQQTIERP
jgi:hypothetical protein